MAALAITYATDENIAVRASADYLNLCPKGQVIARGTDGALAVLTPWLLTSATATWTGAGIAAGQVVSLDLTNYFARELLAVSSVSVSGLTLRRVGMLDAVGYPPGTVAASAVKYSIMTLAPQIEEASYDLNRRFGVDPTSTIRTPSALADIRETRDACVLIVLSRQYAAMARAAGESADDFAAKAKLCTQELSEVLDRLVIHWQGATGWGVTASEPSTSRFSTRLSR